MGIVEAKRPDGKVIEVAQVGFTTSGLGIMIVDPLGNAIVVDRLAWKDIVKAVQELIEQDKLGHFCADC